LLGFGVEMAKLVGIGALARALAVHENTIRNWSRTGKIPFTLTSGGQRRFDIAEVKKALGDKGGDSWNREFQLEGLEEDRIWNQLCADLSISPDEAAVDIATYAFTEMLNNAIDHSSGDSVYISFEKQSDRWIFSITDDGVGVLSRIQENFGLESPLESIGELTKGKRTSAPQAHTGEGIFFTSKMVDKFSLESQCIKWLCDNDKDDFAVLSSDVDSGTRVKFEVLTRPSLTSIGVFQEFTEEHEFTRSRPVIKLFEIGGDFVSRSEAKRLVGGLEKFKDVDLDFSRVKGIGQGFADQVFRVWQAVHPQTKLHVINATPEVEFMINRVKGARDGNL